MSELTENLRGIERRIISSAERAGRSADEIRLVAVSKTKPVEMLLEAISAGAKILGENKVQEAEAKIGEIGRAAEWHFIGSLQSNKARKAVKLFDCIQTLDSIELAQRLERICGEENRASLDVLIQLDLANEATKSGIEEKELRAAAEYLRGCKHLKLRGLMIIPPFLKDGEKVRPYFRRLRELRDELAREDFFEGGKGELSMGMTHDFEAAIEEGATLVRIGTAIFGRRFIT